MNITSRFAALSLLISSPFCCSAEDGEQNCHRDEVDAHVREQNQIYGPLSIQREYFGFVYLYQGSIASAVTRGNKCLGRISCSINNSAASKLIPAGAKVLGEWHTHPRDGSSVLSMDDVVGAHNNRHIRCYIAYYGKPNGEVYAWDPGASSVPAAMASRVLVGRYIAQLAEQASGEVH